MKCGRLHKPGANCVKYLVIFQRSDLSDSLICHSSVEMADSNQDEVRQTLAILVRLKEKTLFVWRFVSTCVF